MVDFFENECDCNGIPYATKVNLHKLKEWADQKDIQIEELRLMVERLAFKDVYRPITTNTKDIVEGRGLKPLPSKE